MNQILIEIIDTKTGMTAVSEYNDPCIDAELLEFMWAEGTYACDCNRGIWFKRALEERHFFDMPPTKDEIRDYKCGSERFIVRVEMNGQVIYNETEVDDEP